MGKASARQDGFKVLVIPRRFLNCDGLAGCMERSVPIAI